MTNQIIRRNKKWKVYIYIYIYINNLNMDGDMGGRVL